MADHESNRLERALLHRAEMEDNDLMDDEMVASYMCSGQLRIIRQLHWTIKGTFKKSSSFLNLKLF